jgi:adenylate kinase
VIVVAGTPGTGKTGFSRLLGRKLDASSINLSEFAKEHDLIERYDRRRRTLVIDENSLRRELKRHLTDLKGEMLVEGHYSAKLVPRHLSRIVFVLRCDPIVLRSRLGRRGYTGKKIRENVEAEVLDVCLIEAVTVHGTGKIAEINTSSRTTADCVKEALGILAGKREKHIGRYDWIAELERRGRLDEFLKEGTVAWRRGSS